MSRAKSAFPRFWNKVDIQSEDDCWEWIASKRANGYGQFYYKRKNVLAHRLAFELFYGSPPDETVDHVCMNKACVNPNHLEDVTLEENIKRYSETITECVRGHMFTDENTYINSEGHRACRTCNREHVREWRRNNGLNSRGNNE